MEEKWFSWGVDGDGRQHYLCNYCEMYFGVIDISLVDHNCDKSKPKYHNRGIIFNSEDDSKKNVIFVRQDSTTIGRAN